MALLAISTLLFSCTVKEPEPQVIEQQRYEYRFSIAETKAFLNDDGVFWEADDQVGLFIGGGGSAAADVDVTTTPKTIVFSTGQPVSPGTMVYAYYPFQAGNADVSAAKITIPAVQYGGSLSAMPMAGIPFSVSQGNGNSGTVHFLNLGSIIDFRIYSSKYSGEQIESVTLAVSAGANAISGEATLDLTAVNPADGSSLALNWSGGVASSVKLVQSGTVAANKDAAVAAGSMYMVVAPGTYSGTITIVTDGATYTFNFTDKEFEANGLKGFNMNLDNATRIPLALESVKMAEYLDYTDENPYDPDDYSISYVSQFSSTVSSTNRLDMPRPVTLTWASSQTGNMSVEVYYDAARTQAEPMAYAVFSTTANSVDVYNLIPNRHCYYTITADGTTVGSGDFYTSGHRRIINVAGSQYGNAYANNCRDFGGLETTDGRRIKYGKIFRGTNMDRTTQAQQDYIKQVMGVELDVDLRSNQVQTPSSDGSKMFNALGLGQIPVKDTTVYRGHTQETYSSISDLTNKSKMGATLTRILSAASNDIGIYIHCKVGADRTGFVCLMLEAILGVRQELCDVDYELTSFCAATGTIPLRERGNTSQTYYYYPLGIDRINQRPGATFQEKAIDYVVNVLGVPAVKISEFQNCMLEPAQ